MYKILLSGKENVVYRAVVYTVYRMALSLWNFRVVSISY